MTKWYKDNYLDLNVDKTREMVVDLRKKRDVNEIIIEGMKVDYTYLRTLLNNNSQLSAKPTTL